MRELDPNLPVCVVVGKEVCHYDCYGIVSCILSNFTVGVRRLWVTEGFASCNPEEA